MRTGLIARGFKDCRIHKWQNNTLSGKTQATAECAQLNNASAKRTFATASSRVKAAEHALAAMLQNADLDAFPLHLVKQWTANVGL
jgi:hypothetical protein